MLMKTVPLLFLCVLLSGCPFGTADGHGVVIGRIEDEQAKSHRGCKMDLLIPPNWEVFDKRNLPDEVEHFQAGFVIDPAKRPYKVRVGCATSEAVFISPIIMLGGFRSDPVDLGIIVLSKTPIVLDNN